MSSWRFRWSTLGLTTSVRRIALFIGIAMTTLVLLSAAIFVVEFEDVIDEVLDLRLDHEIDHLLPSIQSADGRLWFSDSSEFAEPDLLSNDADAFYVHLFDTEHRVVLSSRNTSGFDPIPRIYPDGLTRRGHRSIQLGTHNLRAGFHPLTDDAGTRIGTLQLVTGHRSFEELRQRVMWGLAIVVPLSIVLSAFFSIAVARRAFQPLDEVIRLSEQMSASALGNRIRYDAEPNDILGRVRDTLNNLFGRLEAQVGMMTQFSDNAAHQLMTPLTALGSELDYLTRPGRSNAEVVQSAEALRKQVDRMVDIVRTLLLLSRADASSHVGSVAAIDQVLGRELPALRDPRLRWTCASGLFVRGRADIFWMAMQNLVSNAMKYGEGREIVVTAERQGNDVVVRVADLGAGIPDAEKERIFERFYRIESAERLGIRGFGLGLPLARAIVQGMGGRLDVLDNAPRGTIMEVRLPALDLS